VFGEIESALNVIWGAPPTQRPPVLDLLRTRLASFGMIVSLGFLFLVLMVMNAALAAFGDWLDAIMSGLDVLMIVVNLALSLVTTFVLFALMYRVLPDIRIPWRDVWFGAAVSAALFLVGRWAISTYIASAKLVSTFGAASALVVILIWVYYSAQIFLLGAAIAKVVAERRGERAVELISKPRASGEPARRGAARR
jgi:membrane protein